MEPAIQPHSTSLFSLYLSQSSSPPGSRLKWIPGLKNAIRSIGYKVLYLVSFMFLLPLVALIREKTWHVILTWVALFAWTTLASRVVWELIVLVTNHLFLFALNAYLGVPVQRNAVDGENGDISVKECTRKDKTCKIPCTWKKLRTYHWARRSMDR